ncbi:hypothetical protein TVAG_493850 [Trichomonas vaginalis G3]|uniref:MI domain-containing protein n=1 Tax=Trichomonas vaginalis (strain ATCC PRA-98 / G3) TaxID=412133 RepID=A2DQ16_TRIV3|nr:RNA splicing [Trichomonas vaginalis G3]EAY17443.1 hypothetical protein TVAG_493850 [Trichomonas vaginalis G3]KAI5533538.1 RNA splicing [Trichomonas vaginalis G3]|eukprot:XP_001329578.1 hypothetical protein [Trichomonas vaginalis G3]
MVASSLLAIIHSKLPAVSYNVLNYVSYKFNNSMKKNDENGIICASIFFTSLYRFYIISPNIIFSLLLGLLGFKNKYMPIVIEILRLCAPILDQEIPNEFTNIFTQIIRMADPKYDTEIQKLTRWRAQGWAGRVYSKDYYSYSRIPYRLNALEEYGDPLNDFLIEEITEDPTSNLYKGYDYEAFDRAHDTYSTQIENIVGSVIDDNFEENQQIVQENLENQEPIQPETIETEDKHEEDVVEEEQHEDDSTQVAISENKQKTANLEFQKTIYLTITSTATGSEAAHKLIKILNEDDKVFTRSKDMEKKTLIKPHKQILIETLIEYIGHSKTFDRNLASIPRYLMNAHPDTQNLIEENFRRIYNNCESYKESQIINLARLFAYLLAHDSISWGILSIIRLTAEDTNTEQRLMIRYLIEELAKGPAEMSSTSWLVNKLKEPEIEAATSGIFLTDTIEHAEIVTQFFSVINLEYLVEGVKAKIAMMMAQPQPNIMLLENDTDYSSGSEEKDLQNNVEEKENPEQNDEETKLRNILLEQKRAVDERKQKILKESESSDSSSASGSDEEAAKRRRKHRHHHHRHHHRHHH